MRSLLLAVVMTVFLPISAICAEALSPDLQKASDGWLAMVDQQQYTESWAAASPEFKKRVAVDKWTAAVKDVRAPLGTLTSRTFAHASTITSLPGLPDGVYTIVQFHAVFANKADAVETMTFIPDNGVPKVGGYFIK